MLRVVPPARDDGQDVQLVPGGNMHEAERGSRRHDWCGSEERVEGRKGWCGSEERVEGRKGTVAAAFTRRHDWCGPEERVEGRKGTAVQPSRVSYSCECYSCEASAQVRCLSRASTCTTPHNGRVGSIMKGMHMWEGMQRACMHCVSLVQARLPVEGCTEGMHMWEEGMHALCEPRASTASS